MAWGRLHDGANTNAKLIALSNGAFRLWVAGLIYCQANLTEGFIPSYAINTFGVRARLGPCVKELLTASVPGKNSLWHEVEGGWQMHDYLEWNDSRQTILNGRQTAKQRIALFRNPELRKEVRDRDGDDCRYCGRTVQWHDRKGARGGTYDHVEPYAGNDAANLVVCCRGCNSRKRGRTPTEAGMVLLDAPKSRLESRSNQTTDLDLFQQPQPHPLKQKNQGSTAPRGTSENQDQRAEDRAPVRKPLTTAEKRLLPAAFHKTLDVTPAMDDAAVTAAVCKLLKLGQVDPAELQPILDAVRAERTPKARREQSVSPLMRDTLRLAGITSDEIFAKFSGATFAPDPMTGHAVLVMPTPESRDAIDYGLAVEIRHAFRKAAKTGLTLRGIVVAPKTVEEIDGYHIALPTDDVVHLCELAGIMRFFIGTVFDGALLSHAPDGAGLRLTVRAEAFDFVDRQFRDALQDAATRHLDAPLEIQPAAARVEEATA